MSLWDGARIVLGYMERGLQLNGTTGYASTPAVPVDTSAGFTVTTWAPAASTPAANAALVRRKGKSPAATGAGTAPARV